MMLGTRLVHQPGSVCPHTGSVTTPLYLVSTFRQDGVDKNKGYEYSRIANPTRTVLENTLADLEGGSKGLAFSSGMAAITASLMLLKNGDHLVATEDLYGGTYRIITQVLPQMGIDCSFVDTSDVAQVEKAITPKTRAIFIESPTNPLLKVADIRRIAALGKERGLLTMIDNTFMSPYWQRPLELGFDLVVHSATKSLGGHSDLILGLVVVKDDSLAGRLEFLQKSMGAVPSPFDCWLLLRGIKSLRARLKMAGEGAEKLARWLSGRPEVSRVYYPGLEDHPGHEIHESQAGSGGTMISVELDSTERAVNLLNRVKLWTLAVSLGAVESIITYPARMTHDTYPKELLDRLGISERLVRFSVGIEEVEDLIAALEQAWR